MLRDIDIYFMKYRKLKMCTWCILYVFYVCNTIIIYYEFEYNILSAFKMAANYFVSRLRRFYYRQL